MLEQIVTHLLVHIQFQTRSDFENVKPQTSVHSRDLGLSPFQTQPTSTILNQSHADRVQIQAKLTSAYIFTMKYLRIIIENNLIDSKKRHLTRKWANFEKEKGHKIQNKRE